MVDHCQCGAGCRFGSSNGRFIKQTWLSGAIGLFLFLAVIVARPAQDTPLGAGSASPAGVTGVGLSFLERASSLPTPTNGPLKTATDLSAYVPDDKYKLRVGDRISLQILEDRDLPKNVIVADSGEVDVPYIGRVPASDKTCKQLANELKSQLEKEYYYRATVVIALDVANKFLGRVYVWGQVKNQGPIDLAVNENLTAGKAILRAGGFGDFANKKKIKVVRGAGADITGKQNFEINMVEILEDGKTEKDVVLRPDDFIIVPSRLINF